jgi:hypothetical protein
MRGRRVESLAEITQPGDYYYQPAKTSGGGTDSPADNRPYVFFLLPIARDEGVPPAARAIHACSSPPHRFRFCEDGSVEIRESLGCGPAPYYWHGYLDEGHEWRQV